MKWRDLADHQIRKAEVEGQFDNLKGAGKPLDLQTGGDMASVGFRIMADAGVVPREIELKKAAEAQRIVVRDTSEPEVRKREMAKLADLELRIAFEQDARRKFFRAS